MAEAAAATAAAVLAAVVVSTAAALAAAVFMVAVLAVAASMVEALVAADFHGGGFADRRRISSMAAGMDVASRSARDWATASIRTADYDDYAYDYPYGYDSYYDNGNCYVVQRRVHTAHGWRRQPVQVCG